MTQPTVHATAVRVGTEAVLIRGPSGSGKSRLAVGLIMAGRARQIHAAVLIGDDRVVLSAQDGRLIAQGVPALAGLIEIRGLGIRRCDHVASAPVGLVVDLAAPDATRLPAAEALRIQIAGVTLPRVPVGPDDDALGLVLAALTFGAATSRPEPGDCSQELGNHMWSTLAPL